MDIASKQLISEIIEAATIMLRNTGWCKRKSGIFTCELTKETIGWLGLNTATHRGDGLLEINPVIGVRHQPTERMLAKIIDQKYHPYIPPTVGVHLGYVTPEKTYVPWLFSKETNNVPLVKKMIAAVNEYGQRFMQDNVSLEVICQMMATSGFGVPQQLAYRLPVAYFLLGNLMRAEEYLQAEVSKLLGRTDLAAQEYMTFVRRLREHFNCT